MLRRSAIIAVAAGVAFACGSSTPQPKYQLPKKKERPANIRVPDWVYTTPSRKGMVCATGAVDPTFYRQDGRVYAAEAARNELAKTIQVTIYSVMYDYESSRGGSVRQYIVSEVEEAVAGSVLSGAEVPSYWFDEFGVVSGEGMTYALACMRTDRTAAQLADKIKEAYPAEERDEAVAAVKKRAAAAFDELEAMEEKHAQKKSGAPAVTPEPTAPEPAPEE